MPHGTRWALAAMMLAGLLAGVWLGLRTGERGAPVTVDPLAPAAAGGSAPEIGDAPVEAAPRAETRSAAARTALDPAEPRRWAVRVRTSFGASAVGFPVRFLTRQGKAWPEEIRVRETGSDGCAVLVARDLPANLWGRELLAEVAWIGGAARTPGLVASAWPPEPLVLDLAPIVTVRAAVCDPDGLPAREAGRVRLDCLRDGARFASVNDAYAGGEAVARFPCVPADAALELRVMEGTSERALETLAGPFLAGTEVHVTLRSSARVTCLVGRLTDADGKPLPKQVFQCSLVPVEGKRQDEEGRTGDGGEFRLLVPAAWRDRPLDRLLFSVGRSSSQAHFGNGPDLNERLARLCGPGRIGAAQTDVGMVRLRALELLAAGTIVDESGDPVHNAWVSLQFGNDQDPLEHVLLRAYSILDHFQMFGFTPPQHFQVFGFTLPADARITVSPGVHRAAAPLPLRAGVRDHRLVLVRSGEVVLTATIDPGTRPDVVLQREGSKVHRRPYTTGVMEPSGLSATWAELTPGRYSLLVRRDPLGTFEVVLSDLLIEEGPRCGDPRLRSLDLRARKAK